MYEAEVQVQQLDQARIVRDALACLPERERHIVAGLLSERTLAGMASELGLSKARVGQLKDQALARITRLISRELEPTDLF